MYPEKATPLIQLLTKELHIMSVWCDGKGLNWVPVSTDSFSTHAADAARPVVESNLGFAKEIFCGSSKTTPLLFSTTRKKLMFACFSNRHGVRFMPRRYLIIKVCCSRDMYRWNPSKRRYSEKLDHPKGFNVWWATLYRTWQEGAASSSK